MTKRKLIIIAVSGLFLASCYRAPEDNVNYEDLDMIQTYFNASRLSGTASYANTYSTFAVADSFQFVTNDDDVSIEDVNAPQYRIPLRQKVIDNMVSYGYMPVNPGDTPDVYIALNVSYLTVSGVSYYPIYGGGYGWGYPYYGYGYGWYYPTYSYVPSYYSYDQGSLLIDWMDLKNANIIPDNDTVFYQVSVEWNLSINGLVRTSSENDRVSRLSAAIDQGFKQSPYLKK
jgi:hypothetical protein